MTTDTTPKCSFCDRDASGLVAVAERMDSFESTDCEQPCCDTHTAIEVQAALEADFPYIEVRPINYQGREAR